ncbi:XRE family transcriptional regulator [Streptomyces sp. NPDC020141]|uniref:XRE family transcriptional regulator n=1 Tax=Streptomyces sp. NPDC020141 TaxID=3365065 RepID=UPI00378FE0D5
MNPSGRLTQSQARAVLIKAREDARTRMVARLRDALGGTVGEEETRALLQRAEAWASAPVRELDRYLAERPDGLTAPTAHCPAALPRLLAALAAAGHEGAVTLLPCAVCGRTDRALTRVTDRGRACDGCVSAPPRRCARCGKDAQVAAVRDDGPICRTCYRDDPARSHPCARCGRMRPVARRFPDGSTLCYSCRPYPEGRCVTCGRDAPIKWTGPDGPVCRRCYTGPPGRCGLCGQTGPITVRARDGRPAICTRCYRGPVGTCVLCRRRRNGYGVRAGEFHCTSCRPRPVRPCAVCGPPRPVHTTWPIGPVCHPCYAWRNTHPAPCPDCGLSRVMTGRTPDGADRCGPCSGSDAGFVCSRCGQGGNPYAAGECDRCVLTDRLTDLLGGDGPVAAQLEPLHACLAAAARPTSVIHWLRSAASARLLVQLAAGTEPLTHALLDTLPRGPHTGYARELLVTAGVLPRRDETLAQIHLWTERTVAALPARQRALIRPFAEWHTLKSARRSAGRGQYTTGSAVNDRMEIRRAIDFVTWLETCGVALADATQADLDLWLSGAPAGHRRGIAPFVRWARARRLARLTVNVTRKALPGTFLDDTDLHAELLRCLTDDTLPLDVRITGALTRLYALPASRIARLTTDAFLQDTTGAYLLFAHQPVLLPPRLAALIERQTARPRRFPAASPPGPDDPEYLFPGAFPSRPLRAKSLRRRLTDHGLTTLAARNTAMIHLLGDMPPPVVRDLLGLHSNTVSQWSAYLQDSWADYLAARSGL